MTSPLLSTEGIQLALENCERFRGHTSWGLHFVLFYFGREGSFLICVECISLHSTLNKCNMNRICAPSWLNLCSICITLCFLTSKAIPAYSRIWKCVLNRRFVPVGTHLCLSWTPWRSWASRFVTYGRAHGKCRCSWPCAWFDEQIHVCHMETYKGPNPNPNPNQ